VKLAKWTTILLCFTTTLIIGSEVKVCVTCCDAFGDCFVVCA
jgi:hypothetical protein